MDRSDAGRLKQFPVLRPLVTTGVHLRAGRPLLPVAGSGGVAHQLPEHAVALAALVDVALATLASKPPPEGRNPRMSHIIGRPNDDLLDVMIGHGADPEQAFIGGSEQGLEEGDGLEDRLLRDEPTLPEQ